MPKYGLSLINQSSKRCFLCLSEKPAIVLHKDDNMLNKRSKVISKCNLFLYADDSCLVHQHNDVSKIEQNLKKNFLNICDWFVNNALSIHLGEDKTKCILFGTKQKLNKTVSLDIRYYTMQIKQQHTVSYLGCALDESRSGETMVLKVISKINCRLRFFYRKK